MGLAGRPEGRLLQDLAAGQVPGHARDRVWSDVEHLVVGPALFGGRRRVAAVDIETPRVVTPGRAGHLLVRGEREEREQPLHAPVDVVAAGEAGSDEAAVLGERMRHLALDRRAARRPLVEERRDVDGANVLEVVCHVSASPGRLGGRIGHRHASAVRSWRRVAL